MIRTFTTHEVRKQEELSGKLWEFEPLEGVRAGTKRSVFVPACIETYPGFEAYRGESVFRTRFTAGGNIRLEFKGVSHTAAVSVDGKEAGMHYNAYTPFDVILTKLPEGEHTLEVRVDNRFGEASALHVPNDYMTYGGISRAVALEWLADLYIKQVHVTPFRNVSDNVWNARIEVLAANIGSKARRASITGLLAKEELVWEETVIEAGEEVLLSGTFSFPEAEEWNMEHPRLYELKIVLSENGQAVDDLIERVGFRTVSVKDNRILINGRAVRIKGFCRHEDHPQFGCALPGEAIAYDLSLAKDMGANSIRTSHYPNDEIFLDLCDELGILVWEENHARGLSEQMMRNPNFERQCETVIREMINAHYNHPSIYIWGILNECASDTEYGRECYEKQYALIRSLDSSRPRSSASCRFRTDLCLGYPEVVSYNIYPQWYHDGTVTQTLDEQYNWVQKETEGAGKPFLITEIGAGAIYGYRSPGHEKWTEEYQAETLKKQITEVLNYTACQGMYIWQFCDVRVCREWFSNRPRTMNNKGIVDEYRRRKLSYDVVKRLYSSYSNYWD